MNLFELSAKLSLDSTEYESGLQIANNAINKFKKGAVIAFGAASAAFIAFAKDAVSTGAEFDTKMSQVAATMGLTVDEIGELRDFAQEMGAKTVFSATQAAEALNYMALAGYDAEKSMSMLPTVLNLAAAGNMDLARASDMVTDAQSALGLTMEQSAAMVDQMAKTASTSNTSVEQLGDAMLTIGGTAKFMAGGTDRLQTVLGLLADNGIKGSEAGTHLRNMLLKLSAPTDAGAQKIEELGLQIFDAEGKMRDMQDIILDLGEAMSSMTEAEKVTTISELFNARDLSAVNALLGTSKERWDELGGAIAEASGSAEKMADTQLDNLNGDITLMKSALEGVKIQFSDGITPALRNVVKIITNALSNPKTQKYLKEVGEKIGNIINIIVEKALVAIPRLIDFAGVVLQSLKDNAVAIGAVVLAVKAMADPVGTAVTAVGLLVGALALMQVTATETDEELANLSDSEKELVENARNAASEFDAAMETYAQAVASIDSEMTSVQDAWETLQGLVDENGKIAEGHEKEVQDLLDIINKALGTQYEINEGMITQYQEMVDTVDALIEKQWAQKLLDAKSESYNLAKSQLETAQKRLGIAKLELETKKKALETAKAEKEANDAIVASLEDRIVALTEEQDMLQLGSEEWNALQEQINAVGEELYDAQSKTEGLNKAVQDATYSLGMQVPAYREASDEVDKLVAEIGRYDDAYTEFLNGNYEKTKEILDSNIAYRWQNLDEDKEVSAEQLEQMKRDYSVLYKAYEDYREKLKQGQAGYNQDELNRLQQQMLDLGAVVSNQIALAKKDGKAIGNNIGEGVVDGLNGTKQKVANAASVIIEKAIGAMKMSAQIASPSKRGRAIGANIGGSVGIGIDDSYDDVIGSAEDLTYGVLGALDKTQPFNSYVASGTGEGLAEMLSVLRDIRDNIGNEIVMQDGTLVGWMDKQLGRVAARKARGSV